ncbi:hypothetical protein ACA910_004848 [Epithemia clementina (nom. ined.)]
MVASSTAVPYSSAWSNGFFGVPLETIHPLGSPASTDVLSEKDSTQRQRCDDENVLHSMFSPSCLNRLYNKNKVNRTSTFCNVTPLKQDAASDEDSSASTLEEFFSPAQFSTTASRTNNNNLAASPLSTWTNRSGVSNSSFRSLPSIEMLSADYIQSCENLDQLHQIIQVLETEENYPFLLKLARDRKNDLGKDREPCQKPSQEESTPYSALPNEPSTVLSSTHSSKQSSLVYSSFDDDDVSSTVQTAPPVLDRDCKYGNPSPSAREHRLSAEVQRLTQTILELEETQRKEQQILVNRLQTLIESKDQVQSQVESLEKQLALSKTAKHELLETLEELREANQILSDQLRLEKSSLEHFRRQAKKVEKELQQKILELKQELEHAKHRGQSALALQRKNAELNRLLTDANKSLHDVSLENDVMLRTLLKASGENFQIETGSMSRRDRRRLIASLAEKATASRSALDATVSLLRKSEQNLHSEIRRRRKVDSLLQEAAAERSNLEKENYDLSVRLQNVIQELQASRDKVTSMLQSTHEQQNEDWAAREAKLNNIIAGLRKQINDSSLARLYRAELHKRKQLGNELQRINEKIFNQQEQQQTLGGEDELKCFKAPKPSLDSDNKCGIKPSPNKDATAHRRVGSENMNNNHTPKQVKFDSDQNVSDHVQKRVEMRRASGGRKALQEKVKKMRSPSSALNE